MADGIVKLRRELRHAMADLMRSAGCGCCRNDNLYDDAQERIAKLLNVPKYKDHSGYNFDKFRKTDKCES